MDKHILKKHIQNLKKNVFFTDTKWPHFKLLFNDLQRLARSRKYKRIVSLERGSLYGDISLFAPLFYNKDFISIDCSTKKIKARGSYNKKYVEDKDIIKIPITHHSNYKKINLEKNYADLIIIPNLMHHIYDHRYLLKKCKSILKKNGEIYVFEPTLREIHQSPDDYFRFTPYGLKALLKELNFKKINYKFSGGPFTAVLYCLDQALQYVPKNKKDKFKEIYFQNFQKYIKYDDMYKKNLVRKNTIFPMSFSIKAKV